MAFGFAALEHEGLGVKVALEVRVGGRVGLRLVLVGLVEHDDRRGGS